MLDTSVKSFDEITDDFRISIAGAQSITALTKNGTKWLKPYCGTPTTHILKPPIGILRNGIDLSNSVQIEYLCLKLCEFFGHFIRGKEKNKIFGLMEPNS